MTKRKNEQPKEPEASVNQWARWTGLDRNRINANLERNGRQTGKGILIPLTVFIAAMFESTALEREAKSARHRQQIDEAEMMKNERDVQEGKLAFVSHMKEFVSDVTTRLVQMIRQSDLKEAVKRQWIGEIGSLKFEPTKVVPFKG